MSKGKVSVVRELMQRPGRREGGRRLRCGRGGEAARAARRPGRQLTRCVASIDGTEILKLKKFNTFNGKWIVGTAMSDKNLDEEVLERGIEEEVSELISVLFVIASAMCLEIKSLVICLRHFSLAFGLMFSQSSKNIFENK